MIIYLDLDGPVLDVSKRYHQVYSDVLLQERGVPLDKDPYWISRRKGIPNKEMIGALNPTLFNSGWMDRIESDDYMHLDCLQEDAESFLKAVSAKNVLYLVTLRSRRDQLEKQLNGLGLSSYFTRVLSAPGRGTDRWKTKVQLIQEAGVRGVPSVFIGDTHTDIQAGKELGALTIGVTNGIMDRERLAECSPDILCEDIGDVLKVFNNKDFPSVPRN